MNKIFSLLTVSHRGFYKYTNIYQKLQVKVEIYSKNNFTVLVFLLQNLINYTRKMKITLTINYH